MAEGVLQLTRAPRVQKSASEQKSTYLQARRRAIAPISKTTFHPRAIDRETQKKNEQAQQFLEDAGQQLRMITSSKANRFKKSLAMARAFNQMKAATEEEAKPTQDATRKFVTQAIPKIAGMITMSLNLATGGLAFLFTFFIDFMILGWENLQMIYGRWIMKGKHKIVPPLSWDPIPMPFDGQALVLQMVVILKDLLFLIVMMLPFIIMAFIFAMIASLASAL